MKTENILVLGGNGKTGKRIAQLLQEQGHKVRIGSRSASPSFDWHEPENWDEVLAGMDKIYITYQPDLAVPGALEAIETLVKAIKRSSISKAVLLSGKGEREAQLCEQVLIHSGVDHVIVRASWFNQNFSEGFFIDSILEGTVALPQAEVRIPFVDANDIAEVAVKGLLEEEHNGNIYQLTGPELITFEEAVSAVAKASGRAINFFPISLAEYEAGMRQVGLSEDFIWLVSYLFDEVLGNPSNSELTQDVEKVLGRSATSFAEYAERAAQSGVWNLSETPVAS